MTTLEQFDIEALPVKIDYVGETTRFDKWACDQWRVTLTNDHSQWSTDYFTGLGLRERTYSGYGRKWDAMRKKHFNDKVKKPKIADVLYSLFSDARAAELNFVDWCAEYGYSDDSISAFNTYKQCLDIGVHLRKHFSPDQRAKIETIISEM